VAEWRNSRSTAWLADGLGLCLILILLAPRAGAAPLVVSVGGPAEDPAYLPVHAAAALGTFAAEGVEVALRRAKHPVAAATALRDGEAAVAVTTLDQAIRGAWARGTRARLLLAHTRAPAVALLVAAAGPARPARVEDLRGRPVGIPGPGTTGHVVLLALLRGARLEPFQVDLRSPGSAALPGRLAAGDLAAAMVAEPWASRLLAAGGAAVLVDLRRPEVTADRLGGPFYEVVSVFAVPEPKDKKASPPAFDAALLGYARAVMRVQAWLSRTPPAEVAERLPGSLVAGGPERFVDRLGAVQAAYAPGGEATEAGLAASLRVLRGGSPWPVSVEVRPSDLREPAAVGEARAALGPQPVDP
jgi:NitT/TauT family transport system substrate-binding protein